MTPDVEKIAPVASRPAPMEEVRPLGHGRAALWQRIRACSRCHSAAVGAGGGRSAADPDDQEALRHDWWGRAGDRPRYS